MTDGPTVDAFQPGTAVDVLVTEVTAGGVVGKVMGMLDVTADIVHAGGNSSESDLTSKFKVGSKIKARIIWTLPNDDGTRKVGISVLEHILTLPPSSAKLPENASAKLRSISTGQEQQLALSETVEDAR